MQNSVTIEGVEYRFYSPLYAVSRCGKVLRNLIPFDPHQRKTGYLDCGSSGSLVHRMVAFCWLEKPLHTHHVHHKDHNRTNNHADNLEWVTPQEHMREKHSGSHRRKGQFKLSEEAKEKIRRYRTGRKDSEETRAKKCDILRRVSLKKCECLIDGTTYRSFRSASKILGIHICTIRYRCLSKNFQNYSLVTAP